MQKAIVSGASGFLGKYLVQALQADSYDVQTIGRKKADYLCDLGTEIPHILHAPRLVVHAAGKAHMIPRTPKEEQDFYTVNVQGTINLCRAFDKLEQWPAEFVFISTVAVYGREEGHQISEDCPLIGDTPYAKSKIAAEEFLTEWCSQHKVRLSILRLPLVAGATPPGNLGDMIKGIQHNRYFNIGGGKAQKSIVLASDVARYVATVAKTGGTYNLTDGQHPSFSELAATIASQLGKKQPANIPLWVAKCIAKLGDLLGAKAPINSHKLNKITSTLTFDDGKARKNFGWKPASVIHSFTIN
jgi:nucleoside-diphosphate-sugar epimerase